MAHNSDVENRIIQTNPILEAFGNAKTVMNDNSSRFGKYLELLFTESGAVVGAALSHYLLEKSRVAYQAEREENFHVFAYMLHGLEPAIRSAYRLDGQSFAYVREMPSDKGMMRAMWEELQEAMVVLGFTEDERADINAVLASILHIGNLDFHTDARDSAALTKHDDLNTASAVILLDPSELLKSIMVNTIQARGEVIEQQRDAQKVS